MEYSTEIFCRQARRRRCAYRIYVNRQQRSLAVKRPTIYSRFSPDEALRVLRKRNGVPFCCYRDFFSQGDSDGKRRCQTKSDWDIAGL